MDYNFEIIKPGLHVKGKGYKSYADAAEAASHYAAKVIQKDVTLTRTPLKVKIGKSSGLSSKVKPVVLSYGQLAGVQSRTAPSLPSVFMLDSDTDKRLLNAIMLGGR